MNTAIHRSPVTALVVLAGVVFVCAGTPAPAQPNVIDQVLAQVGDRPYSYDDLIRWLMQLDTSDRVDVVTIGRSAGGLPIPLVAVHDPRTVFGQTMRLFIVARQHGTEMAGTEAMMAIINYLVRSNAPSDIALLQRLTFAIVPVANPDGFVSDSRGNRAGVDLNRDWASLTQPETQAIDWCFRLWQPQAFIDCHELPAESARGAYQENFLETIAEDPGLRRDMTQWCSNLSLNVRQYEVAYGCRLNVFYDGRGSDVRLSHRHFGLGYQVPSFLFESKTGAGRSLRDRVRFHVVGALVVANLLAQAAPAPAFVPPVAPPPIIIPRGTPFPVQRQPNPPAQTLVVFSSPSADRQTFSGGVPLRIDVRPSLDFSYISLQVDGVRRMLSDSLLYEHDLSTDGWDTGSHTIVCQAHDGGGRVLAEARRTILVETNVAGGR